jgi:hypothetical protein
MKALRVMLLMMMVNLQRMRVESLNTALLWRPIRFVVGSLSILQLDNCEVCP